MRHFILFAASLALTGPALACINDTELKSHEREFRSQYLESQYTPPEPTSQVLKRPYVIGGGGVLMAAAGVAILLRLRPQA